MGLMGFFIAFWAYLPWVAVALMAAVTLRKYRESRMLMLQAIGAGALFVLGMGRWLVVDVVLAWMKATGTMHAANIIFGFLSFLALLAFAAGYCGERFARRKPAEVTATPVN
ncbi:MAG TPA: hypothetical protein VHM90_07660 [Phycisphaerae bacterium]|jgi:hypothetical protein|nr:hypothetical protein [Phycisphaerae bacterium]